VRSRARALAIACGTVLAFATVGPAAAAAGDVSIRNVEISDFPTVRLVVSTQESVSLDLGDVRIIENDTPVDVIDVHPLGAASGGVDAVLAIDASNSMRGEPLDTALAAARAFLAGVPDSMPLGIITFSDQPVVLSPVSDDRASVEQAVASLTATTSQGTALFNSVVTASGMFSGAEQHNLILLTDGRCKTDPTDHGPCTLDGSLEDAVAAANAAGVTVFTIGLSGTETAVPTLEQIADQTGGAHSLISLDELEGVYAGLAEEFTRQYVVEYRSKAPLGAAVTVDVRLPIGSASVSFLAPGYEALRTGSREVEAASSFWAGSVGMSVVVGVTFLAVLAFGLVVADVGGRRRRSHQLRSTLVTQVEQAWDPEGAPRASATTLIPHKLADVAEGVAGNTSAGQKLMRRLDHAGWSIRSGEFLWLVAIAVFVLGLIGFIAVNVVGALAGAVVGALVPFALLSRAAARRQAAIQAQLADTLMVIASSMRAGHSFMQSLDSAAKEVDEPAAGEFGRVLTEIRLGRDVEGALEALVERVGSQDLEWAVTAIKIQRKIGGNLAEVLETVAKTIRERETLRRQVKVLSAEGRISIIVLTVLPLLLAGYIMLVNPEYLETLTRTAAGIAISITGGLMMIVGYVWMRKIARLDV
jgi:tight adherence protein B